MKTEQPIRHFHLGDILSITTGRLVSPRHMDGIYDILNFLTDDNLFTHQLPRVCREVAPWMREQYPDLFPGNRLVDFWIEAMDRAAELAGEDKEKRNVAVQMFIEHIRSAFNLETMLPVKRMPKNQHTSINPFEELSAMVGDERIIAVVPEED